eukprot:6207020-Pleurochrysis_carterae.AAC.2
MSTGRRLEQGRRRRKKRAQGRKCERDKFTGGGAEKLLRAKSHMCEKEEKNEKCMVAEGPDAVSRKGVGGWPRRGTVWEARAGATQWETLTHGRCASHRASVGDQPLKLLTGL